jgi:ankyrin repeat protein
VEVVRMILERGADPTVQDKDGRTPFHLASSKGTCGSVRMILERGADPTVQDKDGRTPFHEASRRGHVEVVRMTSRAGHRSDSAGQGRPDTIPLGVALGTCGSVRMILEQGADPTVQDNDGRTPFHFASWMGTCGSDSDDSRAGRRSDSAGQGRLDTIPRGVARGHVEVVQMILEQGADPTVEGQGRPDTIPLGVARGTCGSVRMILEGGADPTVQDKDGRTPFHEASLRDMWKLFG